MSYTPETPLIARLRSTLSEKPPYCSGVLALPQDQLDLYYGQDNARFVNFARAAENPSSIETLAAACQPARFGRGQETVLDESYRKAGKMDASAFLARFDAERSGLMRVVHTGLLAGKEERRAIRTELYKLNVYGEGAFFKPHQDTPRANDMFGTLVVVFPAPHEGGALVLRHDGKEWTFDANELLGGRADAIAYVAFFSDVEHEVLPVRSGNRVTLTYNLYYGPRTEDAVAFPPGLAARVPPHASVIAVRDALQALLDDESFLPEGGTLGFGLRHRYPFPKIWESGCAYTKREADPNPLVCLGEWLKGGDDALLSACRDLDLKPYLRVLFNGDEQDVLLDRMVDFDDWARDCYVETALLDEHKHAELLVSNYFGVEPKQYDSYERPRRGERHSRTLTVHWITQAERWNGLAAHYVAMGNEASLQHLYASVCLLVEIGCSGQRVPNEIDVNNGGEPPVVDSSSDAEKVDDETNSEETAGAEDSDGED